MHKKAIFWNLIWAFKWIANTSAHSTFKEKCKTESTQPPFHWFSHVMHFLFNWMIYITVKPSVNFTIEYIIDDFLQWGLKLRIKKLLVFSLGKFKSSDIEDQIPESTAGLYWFFFCSCSEFAHRYELFKWNPSTDKKISRPEETIAIIHPDLLCNADHSHPFIFSLVFPFRFWCALNSCLLQYLPCLSAQHILIATAKISDDPWFTGSSEMRCLLLTGYFTLWNIFYTSQTCFAPLFSPVRQLCLLDKGSSPAAVN